LEEATAIRRSILLSFEEAERETDPEKQRALLTFVVIGAGPAGVEMSSELAAMVKKLLASEFQHIDPYLPRILLVEAGPRILPPFSEALAKHAHRSLLQLGVEVKTGTAVEGIDAEGVVIAGKHLAAKTVIWLAGVKASPVGSWLDVPLDNVGRVKVQPDLSIEDHDNIFVIGDTAHIVQDGMPLPGLAPVAIQEGSYVAKVIAHRASGQAHTQQFHYRSQGKIATVGRFRAVAQLGKVQLTGMVAWLAWLFVHSFFLIGFRRHLIVATQWGLAYLSLHRRAELILSEQRGRGVSRGAEEAE
jgi:NADH dehydrogenase